MSILDHESPEEIAATRSVLERQLDKVSQAIPEWVHIKYPQYTLAEKIKKAFADLDAE
jgi:hypothetical protein